MEIALEYLRKTYCVEVMIKNLSTEMLIKNIERMIYDVFEWRFLEIDLTCLNLSVFHYILARGTILLWF